MHELSSHPGVNGKGDADRSPGWRNSDFEWKRDVATDSTFKRVSPGRYRKTYGAQQTFSEIPRSAVLPLKPATIEALDQLRGPYDPEDCA